MRKTIITSIITSIATVVLLFLGARIMHSYCNGNSCQKPKCSKSSYEKGSEKCAMYKKHHGKKMCHKKRHSCCKESSDCSYAKKNNCKFHKDFDSKCATMNSGEEKHCKKSSSKKEFNCKHHKTKDVEKVIEKEVEINKGN